jgi:coenzyme PQQ precursor peptide PqqA
MFVRICRIHIAVALRVLFKREVASSEREISAVRHVPSAFDLSIIRTCAMSDVLLGSTPAWSSRQTSWEDGMTWKTPKIVEVPVGMEINMYACAARK